jgi:hypothetical protein
MAEVMGRPTVRYLKNGRGGCWWSAAKERNEAHFGWGRVSREQLVRGDRAENEGTGCRRRREES